MKQLLSYFKQTSAITSYCLQTKFAKVIFLHLSVSHCVHRGVGGVPGQVHPPGRYTPWAGTPPGRYNPGQVHPLGRYTPKAGTPLRQVHPPGRYTPCHNACWDTVNKQAVHNAFSLLDAINCFQLQWAKTLVK